MPPDYPTIPAQIRISLSDTPERYAWLLVWLTRKLWRLESGRLSPYPWTYAPAGRWPAAHDFGPSRTVVLAPNTLSIHIQPDLGADSVLVFDSEDDHARQWLAAVDGVPPVHVTLGAERARLVCQIEIHPKVAARPWAVETLMDMLSTLRVTWPEAELGFEGLEPSSGLVGPVTADLVGFVSTEIWKQVGRLRALRWSSPTVPWHLAQVPWFETTIRLIVAQAERSKTVPNERSYLQFPKVIEALHEPPRTWNKMYDFLI